MTLTVTNLSDQRISPHRFLGAGRWEMGCQDAAGLVAPESLLHRSYRRGARFCLGQAGPPAGRAEIDLRRALYGGMVFDHFGHFITESLARLWPAAEDRAVPLILTLPKRQREARLTDWQTDVLRLLGLNERVLPLTKVARVGECLVPAPGYEIQFTFEARHAQFLSRVPWQPEKGRKLWLSRAGLVDRGGDGAAQGAIDAAMVRAGWQVLRPETLTFEAQLAAYSRAERIAGEEGSALHGVIFLKDCNGLRIDMMIRDPEQPAEQVNANQATICAAKGISLVSHRIAGEVLLQRDGAHVRKVYAAPDAYVAALEHPRAHVG